MARVYLLSILDSVLLMIIRHGAVKSALPRRVESVSISENLLGLNDSYSKQKARFESVSTEERAQTLEGEKALVKSEYC